MTVSGFCTGSRENSRCRGSRFHVLTRDARERGRPGHGKLSAIRLLLRGRQWRPRSCHWTGTGHHLSGTNKCPVSLPTPAERDPPQGGSCAHRSDCRRILAVHPRCPRPVHRPTYGALHEAAGALDHDRRFSGAYARKVNSAPRSSGSLRPCSPLSPVFLQ